MIADEICIGCKRIRKFQYILSCSSKAPLCNFAIFFCNSVFFPPTSFITVKVGNPQYAESRHAKRKQMRSTKLFSSSPNYPKHEFKFASLPREKSAPFSYLKTFSGAIEATNKACQTPGRVARHFLYCFVHSFAGKFICRCKNGKADPFFNSHTVPYKKIKKNIFNTNFTLRYFCPRRIFPQNAKLCLSKISI